MTEEAESNLNADTVRLWKHRRGDRYVLITANVVGNPERGFEIEHYLGTGEFDTIGQAKRAGLRHLDRSDDFNIGAIRNGRLTAILWMGEIVDDEPEVVDGIADEIGPLLIDGLAAPGSMGE